MASQVKILVVDDEPDIRELIMMNIEEEFPGAIIDQAGTGNEAYNLWEVNQYDLIISDVRMPNGTGIELLEKIRSVSPKVPIIFVTAFSEVERDEALAKGANEMMSKPIDFKHLRKSVKDYLS